MKNDPPPRLSVSRHRITLLVGEMRSWVINCRQYANIAWPLKSARKIPAAVDLHCLAAHCPLSPGQSEAGAVTAKPLQGKIGGTCHTWAVVH